MGAPDSHGDQEVFFLFKKLIAGLLLPPTSALLLAIVGLFLLHRQPRVGRVLAWSGVLALFALSLPPVSSALTTLAGGSAPLDRRLVASAQAIVVLGGGLRRNALEYGGDTLSTLSLERARYAATLARESRLPVLVTGGQVYGGRPEAEVMREVLEREYGIPVRWVEAASRNTYENAQRSATLLKRDKVSRVLLVSHGVDTRRARREFNAAGIDVIAAPTNIPNLTIDSPLQLLPSASALQGSSLALHELLGNIATSLGLSGA
jgi:uncharacterized SAM-binding protein YcdF (DUF218 family)